MGVKEGDRENLKPEANFKSFTVHSIYTRTKVVECIHNLRRGGDSLVR
jgi:hypothetical protein